MGNNKTAFVRVGQPTYHRKREYFTIPATGDVIHEINLDYLSYPLIPIKPQSEATQERKDSPE